MGFGQAIKSGFSNYVTFSGRARRSEFWWWYLFTIIVGIVAQLIDGLLGLHVYRWTETADGSTMVFTGAGWFTVLAFLVLFLPTLAMQIRRLHDTDRVGWWWWLNFLCCVGPIILIIFYILPSTPGDNRFGPQQL